MVRIVWKSLLTGQTGATQWFPCFHKPALEAYILSLDAENAGTMAYTIEEEEEH